MTKKLFIGLFVIVTGLFYGCVKDLHNSGISEATLLKGRVLEESEREPLVNVRVTVTNGTDEYTSTKTNNEGWFELTVNYNNFDGGNYLFLDAGSSGITKKVDLKGMGQESYNYGDIFLYNKNDGATPTITTSAVKDITSNGAVCGGNITSDGGAEVTQRGLCWSKSENPTIINPTALCGTGTGEFTGALTGLTPNTKYHVRAFATNSIGTAYGEDREFTTANGGGNATKPTVSTQPISSISSNSADCGGDVTSDGGSTVTERGLCWAKAGTTHTPTISNYSVKDNGVGTGSFSCTMSDLIANTDYYVRAYAKNAEGISYGDPVSFTTLSGGSGHSAPTVITGIVTNITSSSATCSGSVTSNGGSGVVYRGICWSTSPHPEFNPIWGQPTNPNDAEYEYDSGHGTGTFSIDISALSPNTTYYVRAFASNDVDKAYGDDVMFTTLGNIYTPDVSTLWVDDITSGTAKCTGYVYEDGGATVTDRGIQWSTSSTFSDYSVAHSGTGEGMYTCNLTGLSPNTNYYFRAFATNSQGTATGLTKNFMTLSGSGGGGGGGSTTATIILTAGDVWGDGTGYQMLLDKSHSLYGSTIPTDGALSTSCSGNESIYAQFDYKIPTNADGNCSTQHIVHNNSVSITIPAGVYDWCITNPTPDDRIWIASSQGNVGGRQNDYEFEAGNTYEFTVTLSGQNDAVNVVITGGGKGKKSIGQSNAECRKK